MTARGLTLVVALALGASCSGPPWFMGSPLDGHPSIPSTRKNPSYKKVQVAAEAARAQGQTVLELRALIDLQAIDRLLPAQRARLAELLERRAAELHGLGRAIPESVDLERLSLLSPARGAALLGERALAARAAGDAWFAIGALGEARASYERALARGAGDMDFRLTALWGHPPPETTTLAELRVAIEALPLRALPPFALAYVTRGGSDRPTLERALAAARQERLEGLAVRVEDGLRAADQVPRRADAADGVSANAAADAGASAPDAAPGEAPPVPADLDAWVLRGATVSARLLPLLDAHPELLDDVPRAVGWVDLLLVEDDTSPRVLALAAFVFGRARRFGGTERMLMELTYETPDRAAGLARGAEIWERLGRGREACAQWIRAARWRDDPEDPTWRKAIACTRRDPAAGDWQQIRSYVIGRARPERRAALAALLDQ